MLFHFFLGYAKSQRNSTNTASTGLFMLSLLFDMPLHYLVIKMFLVIYCAVHKYILYFLFP